ncbi:MAG TPA: hypothetical protein VIL86_12565 [Tepidisphaeraceae bacterium]|jgi:hypothetical protein
MRRKLFNLLAAVSLVLLACVVVAGVRSFWVADELIYLTFSRSGEASGHMTGTDIRLGRGAINLAFDCATASSPEQVGWLSKFIKPLGFSHRIWSHKGPVPSPHAPPSVLGRAAEWLGFELAHVTEIHSEASPAFSRADHFGVVLPAWFLALLFAILPAIWLRRRMILRKRSRLGLCKTCGYDLRATPLRCPECGTVPAAPAAPSL